MTGHVVAALKANGMWDNTLIVASADNGGPIGSEIARMSVTYSTTTFKLVSFVDANNWPLKGGKNNHRETFSLS